MRIASFTTNFMVWLACCSILVSSQHMGWSSIQNVWLWQLSVSLCLCFQVCFRVNVYMCNVDVHVHLSAGAIYFVDDVCLLLCEVDSGQPLLLFPIVLPQWPGCRGKMDEGARITFPHKVFMRWSSYSSRFCTCCAMHLVRWQRHLTIPLFMCRMVRPKVLVPVGVSLYSIQRYQGYQYYSRKQFPIPFT